MGVPRTVYFAMIDGQEVGPITRAEFALRMAHAVVGRDTFVWTQGMSEWVPAGDVPDLALMFHAREKARSAGLRPPPPPAAALKAKRPAPPPPPAPAAKKPSFQDYSLAAPRSRPGKPAYGGAMPPPFVPENIAKTSEHRPLPSVLIPAPPSEATPELDELAAAVDEDSDEHTTLDLLPLGERVHQEEIASSLFTSTSGEHSVSSSGNTGAVALDEVKFAAAKSGIKQLPTSVPLTTRPSPRPVLPPEPERPRGLRGFFTRLFRR